MYRIQEPRLGGLRIKEWRRRAHLAVGLLFLVLLGSTLGIGLLDHSDAPLTTKMFTAFDIVAHAMVGQINARRAQRT